MSSDRTPTSTSGGKRLAERDARVTAVTDLIEREAGPLLNYFNRRAATTDGAADLLGETLVVVWRRERVIPADSTAARMWLYGVAHKVLAGHHRSSRRRHALTERLCAELRTLPAPTADPEASRVRDLLPVLYETDQEIIRLVYWDGFTLDETAKILSMRSGTVRSRLSRARTRLRDLMNDQASSINEVPETSMFGTHGAISIS